MLRLCSCVHSLCLLNSPPTPCELLLINKFGNFILFYFCFICFIYHFLIFYFFIMCVVCCYCWRAVWCCALLPIIINRVLFRRRATFQVRYFLITSATSHRIHPYLTTSQIKVVEYACQLHYYQPDVWFTLFVYLVCTLMTGCVTVLVVWGYDLNVCVCVCRNKRFLFLESVWTWHTLLRPRGDGTCTSWRHQVLCIYSHIIARKLNTCCLLFEGSRRCSSNSWMPSTV